MSIGIVVPAFRPDVDALRAYVRELDAELDPGTIRIEIDDPEPTVIESLADLPATVNAVSGRRGKGAAVTAGFEALDADVLAFVDADGATPVSSVVRVVDPVARGETPVAVGSRRHPESTVTSHQGHLRRLLGDGFAWDLELLAIAGASDFEMREVPIAWEDKPGSTVAPVRDTLSMFAGLVRARHRAGVVAGSRLHASLDIDPGPSLVEESVSADVDGATDRSVDRSTDARSRR